MASKLTYGTPAFSAALHDGATRIATAAGLKTKSIAVVIGILTSILPFLSESPCFGEETDPVEKQALLRTRMSRAPKATVRNVAERMQRSAKKRNHERLSQAEANTLARASIDDALSASPALAVSALRACAGNVSDE